MMINFHRQGYTLIELLLVVAIVGIAAALIIPRFSSTQTAILKAQARQIVAVLKQARRSAIMEGRQIQSDSKTWHINPEVKLQWSENNIENSDTITSSTPASSYAFTFYPEGGSSGGDLTLNYKGQRIKVKINPLTGKITTEFLPHEM